MVRALRLLLEAGKPVAIREPMAGRQEEAGWVLMAGMQGVKKAIMACSLELHYLLASNHPFPFPCPSWQVAESPACPCPFPWELAATSLAYPFPCPS